MPDLLSTSLSALTAFQRALDVTGHNIANANTPGYSRQVATFATRVGQGSVASYIGSGVQVTSIRRVYDEMLGQQLNSATTGQARFDILSTLAGRLDVLLADPTTGVNAGLQEFFNAVQDVANDPSSVPARQALLGEADGLVQRFRTLDQRLSETESELNQRITQSVADINRLAAAIADVNDQIALAQGRSGQAPSDLLDERGELIRQLSEQISVTTAVQDDGALSVFIGSGQTLVIGTNARELTVERSEFDPTRVVVAYGGTSGATPLDSGLTGGLLGGLLEFRSRMLDPTRQALGQTAVALAQQFNAQHTSGMDLRGALGGDFFAITDPSVYFSTQNAGSGTAAATVADLGGYTGEDYVLSYDGTAYSLSRASDGQPVTMTGAGTPADPFLAEGLSITVAGAPAAGDRLMIVGGRNAAASIEVLVSDAQAIAMALPTRSAGSLNNLGDASISGVTIVDAADPALLTTALIEFTSPTTYSINGAGAFAYTDGSPITINGTEVTISGAPQAGDQFTIEANVGAIGDNGNGLLLTDVQSISILDGGTISINQNYGQLVAGVGSTTSQLQANLDAQDVVLGNLEDAMLSKAGVNLDEEAANLVRFQQSYQAAAQVVAVASTLFDTLIAATRR